MVDLMMWLGIAALLLAAAIQGIGYYQQSAYAYQAKEEVTSVASRIVATASMGDGKINTALMLNIVEAHNAEHSGDEIAVHVDDLDALASSGGGDESAGIDRVSATTAVPQSADPSERTFLKVAHGGMKETEVVYFFKDTAGYKNGVHLVKKGTVGKEIEAPTKEDENATGGDTPMEPTPEPTPTETVRPTLDVAPADFNAPSATVIQYSAQPSQFTHRSVTETTSAALRFSFSIKDATDLNHYLVEWLPSGVGALDITTAPGTGTATALHWYSDVTPDKGYVKGDTKITAKVTNMITNEVSYKTWTITATAMTIVEPPGLSYDRALFNNRSVPSHTSGAVIFGFTVNNVTPADYEVTWTGGENVNVEFKPYMRSDNKAWLVNVTPSDGLRAGTGNLTVNFKHKASGTTITKTWILTVTQIAMVEPTGLSYDRALFNNRSVPSHTSGTVTFGFSITNSVVSDYEVVWSGGDNINAILAPRMRSDNGAWLVDVQNPNGFIAGTGNITATMTHKPTGHTFSKTFVLTATQIAMTEPTGLSAERALFNNRTIDSHTSRTVTFGFSINNSNPSEYEVVLSGGENVNATVSWRMRSDNGAWYVDVKTPNGFLPGTGNIAVSLKHKPTGHVFSKTFVLTVNQIAMAEPSGLSADRAMFTDRTVSSHTSGMQTYGFSLNNDIHSEYEIVWSGGENVNATLTPRMRSDNDAWLVDVTSPTTGYVAGAGKITATMKHIPTGHTFSRTWNLTVNQIAMSVPSGLSADRAVFNDKTAAIGSTATVRFGFGISNAKQSDYTIAWEKNDSLNATLKPSLRADGQAWLVDVAPSGGLVAGTHTVTGTLTHIPTGHVVTKTWKLTVQ